MDRRTRRAARPELVVDLSPTPRRLLLLLLTLSLLWSVVAWSSTAGTIDEHDPVVRWRRRRLARDFVVGGGGSGGGGDGGGGDHDDRWLTDNEIVDDDDNYGKQSPSQSFHVAATVSSPSANEFPDYAAASIYS